MYSYPAAHFQRANSKLSDSPAGNSFPALAAVVVDSTSRQPCRYCRSGVYQVGIPTAADHSLHPADRSPEHLALALARWAFEFPDSQIELTHRGGHQALSSMPRFRRMQNSASDLGCGILVRLHVTPRRRISEYIAPRHGRKGGDGTGTTEVKSMAAGESLWRFC